MSLSNNFPTVGPVLNLDFLNSGVLDPRITFTRASTATYFNSLGVLTTANNDVARFDYNPSTLQPLGLLIEEQRTNLLLQSGWAGAAGGSPGTAPTSWTIGFGTNANTTLVNSIYGTSEQAVRFDADATERIMYIQAINVTNGVQYALSVFVEAVSGLCGEVLYVTSGTATVTLNTAVANPTTSGRYTLLFTATGTGTVNIRIGIGTSTAVGATCSITMSRPQVEAGAFATSYIPTTTTALTRNADVASMTGTNFSSWFNQVEGTVVCNAQRYALIASGAFANLWNISDNTVNERYFVYNTGSGQTIDAAISDGGVSQGVLIAPGSITANTAINTAFAYKVNDFAFTRNATAVQVDTSGTLPTVDRLYIGSNQTGGGQWSGYVTRVAYYPLRNTNAQLQALTGT